MDRKIGAHLSIAGGHKNALMKIGEIGGNCLQLFSSSPRQWIEPKISEAQIKEFIMLKNQHAITPIYFHACYLVNLADSELIGEKSVHSVITDMRLAQELEIRGIVIHLGSFKENSTEGSFKTLISHCKTILDQTPKEVLFIIENAGTHKIGTNLTEIARIIRELHDDRVRVCLDTCHTFAAGYDFTTPEKLETFIHFFDEHIGITKLELFHCNDSRDSFNSFRDRHENIGKGTLGLATFKLLLNHSLTQKYPFILEVPGENEKGPNAENVAILKSLVHYSL
jgi:deoxyribonuclease-4